MIHFLLGPGRPIFRGKLLVSERVIPMKTHETNWHNLAVMIKNQFLDFYPRLNSPIRQSHQPFCFTGSMTNSVTAQEILPAQCVAWQQIDDP